VRGREVSSTTAADRRRRVRFECRARSSAELGVVPTAEAREASSPTRVPSRFQRTWCSWAPFESHPARSSGAAASTDPRRFSRGSSFNRATVGRAQSRKQGAARSAGRSP